MRRPQIAPTISIASSSGAVRPRTTTSTDARDHVCLRAAEGGCGHEATSLKRRALREASLMSKCRGVLNAGVMIYHNTIRSTAGMMFCLLALLASQTALAAESRRATAAQPLPQSVLILDQYAASLPWVGARNSAFRTLLNAGRVVPI